MVRQQRQLYRTINSQKVQILKTPEGDGSIWQDAQGYNGEIFCLLLVFDLWRSLLKLDPPTTPLFYSVFPETANNESLLRTLQFHLDVPERRVGTRSNQQALIGLATYIQTSLGLYFTSMLDLLKPPHMTSITRKLLRSKHVAFGFD